MNQTRTFRRRQKLIKPRLQLRLIAGVLAVSALGFVLEAALFGSKLTELAAHMPTGGNLVEARVPGLLLETLVTSFLLFLPLTVAVGVLATFRLAGPAYRMEKYLQEVARGEAHEPCRIRKGDELQELCDALNAAVDKLRADVKQPETEAEDRDAA